MTVRNRAASEPAEFDLIITRTFDAPRSLVFKAWTEPRHMARWWGPPDYTLPDCEMDAHLGGSYSFCMRSPGGTDDFSRGVSREVVEPERIIFIGRGDERGLGAYMFLESGENQAIDDYDASVHPNQGK
jgi:uncharacterized protein YndB with AHSA1/START domain